MRLLVFILFSAFLVSCYSKDDAAEPNEYAARFVRGLNTSDTFRLDIGGPRHPTKKTIDSSFLITQEQYKRWTGLSSLKHGADSIEIRVDYGVALFSEYVMIILRHDRHKWTARILRIKEHFNIEKERVDSISVKAKYDRPNSGWVKFINELFDLKILTIDHQNIIPLEEYSSASDGDGLGFEFATKNVFRFYYYSNPEIQNKKFWQVRNVLAIKKLLYQEFDVLRKTDESIEYDFKSGVKKRLKELEERNKKKSPVIKQTEITIENIPDTISRGNKRKNKK